MSSPPSGTPDPEDPQSIDAAFHRIVAGYERDGNEPAATNAEDAETEDEQETESFLRGASAGDDWSEWDDVRPQPVPDEVEPAEDEGHYVPPEPAPVRVADPKVRWAWIAAIGAPLAAILLPLLGWNLSGFSGFALVVIFLSGFGYLISQLRTGPRIDDGPDDGAVV